MQCMDFKGGIGTASRVVRGFTVGVLVMTNFGDRENLLIDGVPVGREIVDLMPEEHHEGSCIVITATDAPMLPHQLRRIAQRSGLGLARCGSTGHNGSGELMLAFSTTNCDDPYYYYYYGPACSGGLVLADPELGDASLVLGGYPVFNPSWARNGTAIAFESFDEQQGDRVLKLLSVSSNAVVPIDVMGPQSKEQPSWAPDGTRIAFVCRWAVNIDICTVPAIGGIPVRMTDDAEVDLHPAWSPDGSRIAFARTPAGSTSPQIVLLDVATKQRTVLTGGTDPAWSPDGSKLVFTGADGLFVIDANGSNRRRLTIGPDHAPAWRP